MTWLAAALIGAAVGLVPLALWPRAAPAPVAAPSFPDELTPRTLH